MFIVSPSFVGTADTGGAVAAFAESVDAASFFAQATARAEKTTTDQRIFLS